MAKANNFVRAGIVKKVALGKMRVPPHAQRELKESWVFEILSNFDPDKFKMPVLSDHGDYFNVIDGQHGTEALKRWLGEGWESQTVDCIVHCGLSDAQEADLFLSLNRVLSVNAFEKFEKSVNAGYADEVHIKAVVVGAGLRISRDVIPGAISCVNTLRRVYKRSDGQTLGRALRITRDAYGDPGFESIVIDGIGYLCQRYNGVLDEKAAIGRLSEARGGVNGLLGRASVLHKQTGNAKSQCVAAAAADIINAKRGGKKLPSWWKAQP